MMLSFTIKLISVLSFHASLCRSTNVRHLLAEEASPLNFTLVARLDKEADAQRLRHGLGVELSTARILSSYTMRHLTGEFPKFPPHFWDNIAPFLLQITDDYQVTELQEFLWVAADYLSQNPPGFEQHKLFELTRDRSVKELVDIIASFFNLKVPSFLRVYDFQNHNAESPDVPVQIAYYHKKTRELIYVRSVSKVEGVVDAKQAANKLQTIWNIGVLAPEMCELSDADLADGKFCCHLQSAHYQNEKNYFRVKEKCAGVDCVGGTLSWTYLIAHVRGSQVKLQSYHWGAQKNSFVSIDLDEFTPDHYRSIYMVEKDDAFRFILHESFKQRYPAIHYRNTQAQTWEDVMRIVDETNAAGGARERDDGDDEVEASSTSGDLELAQRLQQELDGEAAPEFDPEPQLGGGAMQGTGELSLDIGFEEDGVPRTDSDEQIAKAMEIAEVQRQIVQDEDELAQLQKDGKKPIPPDTLAIDEIANGIAIKHRYRNRFVQMIGDKKVDCFADSISKESAVWIIEQMESKGDGLCHCKLRNYAVKRPQDEVAFLRFNDKEEIDVLGHGGPWNVFRVEYYMNEGEEFWRFYSVKWQTYLYVGKANELIPVEAGTGGEISEGTLFRLVGKALNNLKANCILTDH